MKDRIPQYPGRVKLLHVKDDLYDLTRADEAVEQGTPLNKSTLLTDETATALGLDSDNNPTVNDALLQTLANLKAGVTTHDQSVTSHSDIRASVANAQNTLQANINSVQTTLQANINTVEGKIPSNSAIQQMINSGVATHNQSATAHSDIRASVANAQNTLQTNINNVNSGLTSKIDAVNADLLARINAADATISGMTKCQFGAYVGTGVYGRADDNRSALTFQFAPTLLFLWTPSSVANAFYFFAGKSYQTDSYYFMERFDCDYNSNYYVTVSWSDDGKTARWGSSNNASVQFNSAGTNYFYIALA